MDMEALNQNVDAKVIGIVSRSNQPFANSIKERKKKKTMMSTRM